MTFLVDSGDEAIMGRDLSDRSVIDVVDIKSKLQ